MSCDVARIRRDKICCVPVPSKVLEEVRRRRHAAVQFLLWRHENTKAVTSFTSLGVPLSLPVSLRVSRWLSVSPCALCVCGACPREGVGG